MALGTARYQVTSGWVTAITAGGPATRDAATVTSASSIDGTKKLLLLLPDKTEYIAVRLGYDTATTLMGTDCVVKVLGRRNLTGTSTNTTDDLAVLRNRNNSSSMTLSASPSTDFDDTLSYTDVDEYENVVNVKGCNEIVIAVETAFAPSDGSTSTCIVQVKVVDVD